ncbi:hypothetical protein F2Q69_00029203 [Brassica cretica]|uniref:Uncharacterized protein n=1 Tax=Brassica cretica TaxID=69181 RepID=A0A8S9S8R2_BRACR|nr:hypothetical protein F2Q69_00029203 [Brassica cretica]
MVRTGRGRHKASWSGQAKFAIWRAGRDRPSLPYGERVGTVLALAFFGWF